MSYNNVPPTDGTDIQDYSWLRQFPLAVQERAWAARTCIWPFSNFQWQQGFVQGLVDNGDGTLTLTDNTLTMTVNQYATNSKGTYFPANYDLVIDQTDETKVLHCQIISNTAHTITLGNGASSTIPTYADMVTGKWINSVSDYVTTPGQKYYIIRRGGIWWSERWFIWPNDPEKWIGTALVAGAKQIITSLTSSGTTATAIVKGHQFISSDSVTIAGATSTNNHFNGTFSVTVTSANTFTYTLAGSDDLKAGGSPTALEIHVGAHDTTATYPHSVTNDFAEDELMVEGSDGLLKRIPILSNDGTNLIYTRASYTVSGQYAVVKTGNRYRIYKNLETLVTYTGTLISVDCNPYSGPPFRWYHGPWDRTWSRYPDDTLEGTPSPKQLVLIPNSCGGGAPDSVPCFDVDVWTEVTSTCNPPDKNYTPDLYRTFHGLQVACENISQYFMAPYDPEGSNVAPANFRTATWFFDAGINSTLGSTTTLDGVNININSVGSFYDHPITVWYCTTDGNGQPISNGQATLDSATHLTAITTNFTGADAGQAITISKGFTRKYPNEFLYFYDRRCWLPDFNGTSFVDPPSGNFLGSWFIRPKSTQYKEVNDIGQTSDTYGYRPFVTNDFVRYVGDNWNDGNVHETDGSQVITGGTDRHSQLNNFYEGNLSATNQTTHNALLSGVAVDGPVVGADTFQINTTKSFWNLGTVHTETGTATGGSTTQLQDTSKYPTNSVASYWNIGRGVWSGFTVEISNDGGSTFPYKRIITTYDNGGFDTIPKFNWDVALPFSASGKHYRIKEPRVLNYFKDMTVTVTLLDGTQHTLSILGNDDSTIFVANQGFNMGAGVTWVINENLTGGVWQWDGSKWIVPTGNDPRTGVAWKSDQTKNEPTFNICYGNINSGDYFGTWLFSELKMGLSRLIWTQDLVDWGSTGISNDAFGFANNPEAVWSDETTEAEGKYNTNQFQTNGQPPYIEEFSLFDSFCYTYTVGRRFAQPSKHNTLCTHEQSTTYFYIKGGPPSCNGSYTFNNFGDDVTNGTYHEISSDGPNTNTGRAGSVLGSLTLPPTPSAPSGETHEGYSICDSVAITKHDVGFIFI